MASVLRSPPLINLTTQVMTTTKKKGKLGSGRMTIGIVSRLGVDDPDPLFQAARTAASLRFQETLRPDPLFNDPYAGCFLPSITSDTDMKEHCTMPITTSSPCHYSLATKFIDDKLLSIMGSLDDVRQIVLLTDGMDTRPYRLKWPRSSVVYDISPGRVFKYASQRLEGVGAKIPKSCMLIHVPVEAFDLSTILCEKGFSGNMPSLWALQGLPLLTLARLEEILFMVSCLATTGCLFMGELPPWLPGAEFKNTYALQEWMEKLFLSHGFQVDVVGYDEVARNLHLKPPPNDYGNILFVARQLRLSDAQMESWRAHFERLEEFGDEEGFEEL